MNIIPMNYEGKTVRTIIDSGKTLFVAKDIAETLGYKDTVNAIKHHCKGVAKHHPLQTPGGIQEVRVIEEPDVYRLITNSQLPSAHRFERWIFEDVLPTIQKTGSYQLPKDKPITLLPVDREFRAAIRMAKAAGLKGNQAVISANNLTKRMTGYDCLDLLGATHLVTKTQERFLTATELGAISNIGSAQSANKMLVDLGLQEKAGKSWVPTQTGKKYAVLMDTGKRHSDGTMVQQIKWRESVALFMVEGPTA